GERIAYLPSVGLCIAAASLVALLLDALRRRGDVALRVGRSVLVLVFIALCIVAAARNRKYASNDDLYHDMVKTAPDSARAWYQIAELERQQGNLDAAVADYQHSATIMPDF